MALNPGARLGPFEITALLGVGGMGEVYRATDTNLKRQVAIKVLPESVAGDAERLTRFQREAEIVAALNHPNIAHVHGLEKSSGTIALVMELVDGPTLSDRIADGAIAIPEALAIAKQIADALDAAHEQGIVHRDLKPANIKVRDDGTVKVLDFGLAKALEPSSARSASASISPTITSPAMTQAGIILGTAAYMSPEQAVGKPVDKRSDLWSFGVVLLEMLTGRQVFHGETVSHVLASVLKDEPDWSALPASTPVSIRRLLRRCLEKDRKRRLDSAAAARLEIDDALTGPAEPTAPSTTVVAARQPLWKRAVVMMAVVATTAIVAGGILWSLLRPAPAAVVRTTISTSGATTLSITGSDRDVAITPDGSRIVYRGANGQLLVRALNQLEPTVLSGLGTPRNPFISPDGQWIGYFDASNRLRKVAITGGPPVTITTIDGVGGRGATWGPDGTIIFATGNAATGLLRVSAAGGEPVVLTKPERAQGVVDHFWPEFLPGGKAVLFTAVPLAGSGVSGADNSQIAVLDLQTGASRMLIRGGSDAHYVASGHLVYAAAGTLRAVPFDLSRLEIAGTPTPVLEGVVTSPQGMADSTIAANGSMVYVPGRVGNTIGERTMVSIDRDGHVSFVPGVPPNSYRDVRGSPDGTRLALATLDDVWTYDLARATLSRLTTNPAADTRPLWTPNGQRIVFSSDRAGYPEIFWRPADGTGDDERLLTRDNQLIDLRASGWSPDGSQLLFTEVRETIQCAIGQIPIQHPDDVKILIKDEFCNDFAAVSPDGRWLAYDSNLSGRKEIYVQRYPELGRRKQISAGGGTRPFWSPDGRELFFSTNDRLQLFVVPVRSGDELVAGQPKMLFEAAAATAVGGGGTWPVDFVDGRFYVIRNGASDVGAGPSPPVNLILIQNWFEELKRLVPRK